MLSFVSLAVSTGEASAYFALRGVADWPAAEAAQSAALWRGQDYIAREYNGRWAEEWDGDSEPNEVRFAIFEAALVEARDPGFLSRAVRAADAKALTRVGEIGWTPIPSPGGVEALRPRLLHVEAMLRPVLRASGVFLERA